VGNQSLLPTWLGLMPRQEHSSVQKRTNFEQFKVRMGILQGRENKELTGREYIFFVEKNNWCKQVGVI